jgi:hypothetical protein
MKLIRRLHANVYHSLYQAGAPQWSQILSEVAITFFYLIRQFQTCLSELSIDNKLANKEIPNKITNYWNFRKDWTHL